MLQFMKKFDNLVVGTIWAIVGWAAVMSVTTFILLCMDSMECFLHTLRLHWVEFQNKFFKGDGLLWKPMNYDEREELIIEAGSD